MLSKELVITKRDTILNRIYERHLRTIANSDGNIFYISDTYPGVWLEHVYDGLVWADYNPNDREVAANYVRVFIKNQKEDGQLPCFVWQNKIGYSQIQECVSFGRLCIEAVDCNPQDKSLLADSYNALSRWDEWLCKNRMSLGTGLIETFCGFDTGHDNSGRFNGVKYPYNISENGAELPKDDNILPMLSPDMNAVFFGDRTALCEMASRLGLTDEAEKWRERAEAVRRLMFEYCYDDKDMFFYDVDKNGNKVRVKSISITNVFSEHMLDKSLGCEIFEKHLHNKDEFWTPYPFPAVAANDPAWIQNKPGNSWGYYSQGLTALRTLRWMEHYGKANEMEELMNKWLGVWLTDDSVSFGQELHPITGKPSVSSPWYSSCMLFTLQAIRRIYGV